MKFELPGQLKGPECRVVVKQAIALRRKLEPWFEELANQSIRKLAVVLRVDGSLGSFGTPGIENIKCRAGVLECDVVIEDMDWKNLSDVEIRDILNPRVLDAVKRCFDHFNEPLTAQQLESIAIIAG